MEDNLLYHGTIGNLVGSILEKGMPERSCWGSRRVAEYYALDGAEETGHPPVLICKPRSSFDASLLEVDQNSVAEPLTYTLGRKEEDLWEEYEASPGRWQDSLEIYESVLYMGAVSVSAAEVIHLGGLQRPALPVYCKVLAQAANGEPKIVELEGGWKLGRVGLIPPGGGKVVHCEAWGGESLGFEEWKARGLSQERIEAAWVHLQGLEKVADGGLDLT